MQLYLIRHGQSTNNALGDDQTRRTYDSPLTETGKEQAQLAGKYLATEPDLELYARLPSDAPMRYEHHPHHIHRLYCSAMHRAIQTAYPIAQSLGLKPEIWTDIHEHGGIYLETDGVVKGHGGRTRSQILEEFPDCVIPETVTETGWWNPDHGMEDITLCAARAERIAEEIRARAAANDEESIALVTHGTFMDRMIKALLGYPTNGEQYYYWHYNTAITRLDFTRSGRIFVRYVNRVAHLPARLIT
jgi:2,3-bisphosphoglycerate-dependent phosphoglycerate mutase